jgi:hypothetical protein
MTSEMLIHQFNDVFVIHTDQFATHCLTKIALALDRLLGVNRSEETLWI